MKLKYLLATSVVGLSAATLSAPASAQSTGSVEFEEGTTITVTGVRDQAVGGVEIPDTPKAKQELNEKLRTNTQSINGMVKLKDDRAFYDKELGEAQADVAVDSSFRNAQEAEEKKRLLQLSDLQTQEIQKLRDEIGRLSRKGGHVLPPSKASAVPTLPPI